ncbi:MlaD family protein [Gordonia terrae]
MKSRHVEFWTVTAIVVVAAVVAGIALVARDSQSTVRGYCAILPDSIGVYSGNPVTQMGFEIGSIDSVTPADGSVRVDFDVDASRPIPASARAVTRSKSVLADNSLELVGNYSDGPELVPGECIPMDRTFTRKSISEIAGSLADLIEEIAPNGDTKNLQVALSGAATSLDGTGDSMAGLMRTASVAVNRPEPEISDLGSIIVNMAPLTDSALAQWQDVADIMQRIPNSAQVTGSVIWSPAATNLMGGLTPVFKAINDIQGRYGEQYIWPLVDQIVPLIHLAATKVPDIQRALEGLPAIATGVALITRRSEGHGLRIAPPRVRVPATRTFVEACRQMNGQRAGSCTRTNNDDTHIRADISDLIIAGLGR